MKQKSGASAGAIAFVYRNDLSFTSIDHPERRFGCGPG